MADRTAELPRWDVSDLYPSLTSREWAAAHEQAVASVTRLTALFDQHDVHGGDAHEPSADEIEAFDEITSALNTVSEEVDRLQAYV